MKLDDRSPDALLSLVAAYYVFDLQYDVNVSPTMLFLQDVCLGEPDQDSGKFQSLALFKNVLNKVKASQSVLDDV